MTSVFFLLPPIKSCGGHHVVGGRFILNSLLKGRVGGAVMGLVGGLVEGVAGLHQAYFNNLLMERAGGLVMGLWVD